MADDRYVELIHKELDGTISYFERARLNRYLRSHDDARRLRQDLVQMEQALHEVEPVDAPADLRQNVMALVRPRVSQPTGRRGRLATLVESLAGRMRAQPAYALGLGFALGVLVIAPFIVQYGGGPGISTYEVSGTLVPGVIPRAMTAVDHLDLGGRGLEGAFETHAAAGVVLARLAITSAEPVVVQVSFDPRAERFTGLVNETLTATYVNSDSDRVTLRHTGREEYWFIFSTEATADSKIDLRVLAGAQVLFEGALFTRSDVP